MQGNGSPSFLVIAHVAGSYKWHQGSPNEDFNRQEAYSAAAGSASANGNAFLIDSLLCVWEYGEHLKEGNVFPKDSGWISLDIQ